MARAAGFLDHHGLGVGDRLLTLLPNTPETFALGLAAMLEGVVQVPLPAGLTDAELEPVVANANPHLVAVSDPARQLPGEVPNVGLWPNSSASERAKDPSAAWPRTRPMAYTSGTTGVRKGVYVGVHDPAWGRAMINDELEAFGHRHGERHLVVSPLYHSGPFRFAAVTALAGGQVAVLPEFSPQALHDALRRLRPTSIFCVPTHLHRLLSLPATTSDDLASLQLLAHAGAPCPVELKERVLELAPEGTVWEFYGSTEGQFTVCPPDVWRAAPGTVGRSRPGREVTVRDPGEDGVGTVWVTAPWHARWEYWRDAAKTAAAWEGAAFTVGDLGHFEGEDLFLDGRPGDLVVTGGVNVYPAEVEAVLRELNGVAEAVVFGLPDEDWGQRLVAAVTPRPTYALDPEVLTSELRDRLAPPKIPKQIRIVDELPRTPTGKVRRTDLGDALGF